MQDLAALKDLLVAQVAAELRRSWQELPALRRTLVDEDGLEEQQGAESKKKRMFAPLSGLPGELPTIKRQIRYHQCYFNPISCFRCAARTPALRRQMALRGVARVSFFVSRGGSACGVVVTGVMSRLCMMLRLGG